MAPRPSVTSIALLSILGSATCDDPPTAPVGLGFHMAFIGDEDGDGCDEYALAVRFKFNRVFVQVFSGKDGELLRQLPREGLEGAYGSTLAAIGDQDGDGLADLIVTVGTWQARSLRVLSTGSGEFLWSRAPRPEETAWHICSAGDVDGDGHADVALLVEAALDGRDEKGEPLRVERRLRILSGPDGRELRHAYVPRGERIVGLGDVDGDGTCELGFATDAGIVDVRTTFGELVQEIPPPFEVTRFSGAVASAGDHDRDGLDDIAIGYPWHGPPYREPGRVHIVSGGTGERITELRDSVEFGGFGRRVVSAGDLDGDRSPDLFVARYTNFLSGTVLFASGAEPVVRPCEGIPDVADLAYALASGGDVDGDGVLDLLVGNCSEGQPYNGSVLIVSGRTQSVIRIHGRENIREASWTR